MSISTNVSSIASSIFSKLDTKSQGYLEKADIQKAFENIDSSDSSSTDIDAIFSKMDSDSDGKITESELTTSINNLVEQLNSQMNTARASMPPPPPPSENKDEGFTKDELTEIASTTDDTTLSSLMTTLASNFEAADTNEDGKVDSKEALAYEQSSTTPSSSATSTEEKAANTLHKIAQLIHAYGFDDSSSTSSISATA